MNYDISIRKMNLSSFQRRFTHPTRICGSRVITIWVKPYGLPNKPLRTAPPNRNVSGIAHLMVTADQALRKGKFRVYSELLAAVVV